MVNIADIMESNFCQTPVLGQRLWIDLTFEIEQRQQQEQAWAELIRAQLKLELSFTLIFNWLK